jgi:hypothetical protein
MTKLRGVGIGLVFLVGCAVGGASSRFVVPPASAQQAATLTRWEYFCANGSVDDADKSGAQGWELVQLSMLDRRTFDSIWCFKRPLR